MSSSSAGAAAQGEYVVKLRNLANHPHQHRFVDSKAKRKVVCAGRRGGKTKGAAQLAVETFLAGPRILYAAPTTEQIETFWREVKEALAEPIGAGVFYKNETEHVIEIPGTKQRIRAKTAWNADTLRGDYVQVVPQSSRCPGVDIYGHHAKQETNKHGPAAHSRAACELLGWDGE